MIKNKIISIALFVANLFIVGSIKAQSLEPQSLNSAGTKMTQSNGSLSFTVGELVVTTQMDSQGNSLGGGFTTGATLTTVSVQEPDVRILNVNVFPNPTSGLVTVSIQQTNLSQLVLEIIDLNGKVLSSEKYNGINNSININTASWISGIYFLNLKTSQSQLLGTYKIVKQ